MGSLMSLKEANSSLWERQGKEKIHLLDHRMQVRTLSEKMWGE